MYSHSLLGDPGKFSVAPFPHLTNASALPASDCSRLIAEFPQLEVVAGSERLGTNQRFSYQAHKAISDARISDFWREFIAYHVSTAFWQQIAARFAPAIESLYPDFEQRYGQPGEFRVGIRGRDSFATADVLLDAQISINTPVVGKPTSVRTAHVDLANKLIFGLYYLRLPEDDSVGGDLEIYSFKGSEKVFRGVYVNERHLRCEQTVPYAANQLIIGVNSHRSLHGVSTRQRTRYPRLFVNLVAEVKAPLYSLAPFTLPSSSLARMGQAARGAMAALGVGEKY